MIRISDGDLFVLLYILRCSCRILMVFNLEKALRFGFSLNCLCLKGALKSSVLVLLLILIISDKLRVFLRRLENKCLTNTFRP